MTLSRSARNILIRGSLILALSLGLRHAFGLFLQQPLGVVVGQVAPAGRVKFQSGHGRVLWPRAVACRDGERCGRIPLMWATAQQWAVIPGNRWLSGGVGATSSIRH